MDLVVEDFIETNLGLIKSNTDTIKEFLVNQNFLGCKKFICYACTGETMNSQDDEGYYHSMLYQHQMTLRDVNQQDQASNSRTTNTTITLR